LSQFERPLRSNGREHAEGGAPGGSELLAHIPHIPYVRDKLFIFILFLLIISVEWVIRKLVVLV